MITNMKARAASARLVMKVAVLSTLLCPLGLTSAQAGGVTINGENPRQSINLSVDNASIGMVLQALHDKYAIQIGGLDESAANDLISITLSGSLPRILGRLLRNQNYMIVRSQENVTGVEKILLIGSASETSSSASDDDSTSRAQENYIP